MGRKARFRDSVDEMTARQARGMSAEEAAKKAASAAESRARLSAYMAEKGKASRRLAVAASAENRAIAKKAGHTTGYQKFLKKAGVGLLSPAGLAEGVAGATVRAMRDAGVPMDPSEAVRKGMFGKKAQKAAGKRYSRGPESS